MNPLNALYRAFTFIDPYVGWFCLTVGLVMFLLTLIGLSSFGEGWRIYLASLAGWLVLAADGFDRVSDYLEEEC